MKKYRASWVRAPDSFLIQTCIKFHSKLYHVLYFQILVSVSYDDSVNFYKFDGDEFVLDSRIENAHESTVWSASFNSNDSFLVTVSDDTTMKVWQRPKQSCDKKWRTVSVMSGCHGRSIYYVDWYLLLIVY